MKGTFFRDDTTVYVFAAFALTFNNLRDKLPGATLIWVNSEEQLERMRGLTAPIIYLTEDYKENPVTDDYRFRQLVSTGQL